MSPFGENPSGIKTVSNCSRVNSEISSDPQTKPGVETTSCNKCWSNSLVNPYIDKVLVCAPLKILLSTTLFHDIPPSELICH